MPDPSYEILPQRGRCILSNGDDKYKDKDKYNDKDKYKSVLAPYRVEQWKIIAITIITVVVLE